MELPIELLMYQMGGKLPTLAMPEDFLQIAPTGSFMPNIGKTDFSPFDPTSIIQMEQLNMQAENQALNEARIKVEEARAKKFEEEAKQREEKEDKAVYDATIKYYQTSMKDVLKRIDPITGLVTDLPGARTLSIEITKKANALRESMNEVVNNTYKGNKADPEIFKKVQANIEEINSFFETPKYKKLFLAQNKLKELENILKSHRTGEKGYIVNQEALDKARKQVQEFFESNEDDIDEYTISSIVPDDLLFNKEDFESKILKGVAAYAKGNQNLITEFKLLNINTLKKDTMLTQDLTNTDKFIDNMVKFAKLSPGGESYINSVGEQVFRNYVFTAAQAFNPNFGEKLEQSRSSTIQRNPASPGSGSSSGKLSGPPAQAEAGRSTLSKYGLRVGGDDGTNSPTNPAYNNLIRIDTELKDIQNDLSNFKEGVYSENQIKAFFGRYGLERKSQASTTRGTNNTTINARSNSTPTNAAGTGRKKIQGVSPTTQDQNKKKVISNT